MYIYSVKINDRIQEVVCLLSPQEVDDKGLPSLAIIGKLDNNSQANSISSENFVPNPKFIDFFHDTVAKFTPSIPSFIAEAKRQNDGWIYIIDARCTKPQESVLPEDIVGAFEIKAGEIIDRSYQRNNSHLLFSQNGFFKLEPILYKHLIEEVRQSIVDF